MGEQQRRGAAAWLTPVTHPKDTPPAGSVRVPPCACTPGQRGDSCRRAKPCFGASPTHLVPRTGAPQGDHPWGAHPCLWAPTPAPPACAQLPPTQPPQLCPGFGRRRLCLAPDQGAGCRVRIAGVQGAECGLQGAGCGVRTLGPPGRIPPRQQGAREAGRRGGGRRRRPCR